MKKWMKDNDILLKTLSLLVALLLWFYVMDSQNPDIEQTVSNLDVQFRNLSHLTDMRLIMTEGNNSTVTIRVRGKRNDMNELKRNTVSVVADLSSITVPGEYNLVYTVNLDNKNLNYTRVTSAVPITVDRVVSKSVPVKLELKGKLAEGYVQGQYTLSSEAVTVEGPERVLETIANAVAVYDMTDTTSAVDTVLDYTLVDENGKPVDTSFVTLLQPTLQFEMQVHQSGEIPLTVDVTPYGFITADMLKCDIKPATIKVSGEPGIVSTIKQINLGSIGVKQLLEDNVTELTFPITLPNGVSTDSGEAYARVTVTFKGLRQMVVNVTSDRFSDIAPFTYKESGLSLIFMGADEDLSALTAEHVTVMPVYNPDELSVGENVVPVSVSVGARKCALVGKYTLTVVVPDPSLEPDDPGNTGQPSGPEE